MDMFVKRNRHVFNEQSEHAVAVGIYDNAPVRLPRVLALLVDQQVPAARLSDGRWPLASGWTWMVQSRVILQGEESDRMQSWLLACFYGGTKCAQCARASQHAGMYDNHSSRC